MNRWLQQEFFNRRNSGTEELGMAVSDNFEMMDGPWVKKKEESITRYEYKDKELIELLTWWERAPNAEEAHRHPVKNGTVNLHPSDPDLETWERQYKEFWITDHWIIWFDAWSPVTMRRVKYTRDGQIAPHDLWGKQVLVSRITQNGKWDGWSKDVELEDTWRLQRLEDDNREKEIQQLENMLMTA